MELIMLSLLTSSIRFLNIRANVIAAIEHLKNDRCIAEREISLINSPPVLHKSAAVNT
jgi:hypothetical protein